MATKQKHTQEEAPAVEEQDLHLDRSIVVDTLTRRMTRDIETALKYVEAHEVVGVLELIKASLVVNIVNLMNTTVGDSIKGENTEH